MQIDAINRSVPILGIDTTPTAPGEAGPRELIAAVRAANQAELFGNDRELSFTRDAKTHTPVLRIKDRSTGEVLKQIPPEQLLKMLAELQTQSSTEANA